MRYRPDIDGLRTVAVGLVLLFHANLGVTGGFIGVDVFFVISGFLITRTISDAHDRGGFSILTFYDHRARRILPALVPLLLAASVAAGLLMLPKDFSEFGKSLAATAVFASNIQFWRASGYFASDAALNPLLHTWSLGVEEQFYIFFPILMIGLFRFGVRARMLVLAVLAVFSFVLSWLLLNHFSDFTFYMLPTRTWELLVGSLLSFSLVNAPRPAVAQISGIAGLALIFGSAAVLGPTSLFPGPAAAPSVIGAALVIYAGLGAQRTAAGTLLSTPPFRFVGLRSYSLYLWHWPILVFYSYVTGREPQGLVSLALLLASLIMASLSYRFVEQPWRRRSPGTPVAVAPLVGLGAMAILFLGGAGLFLGHGFPQRLPAEVVAAAEYASSAPPQECLVRKADQIDAKLLCRIGDPTAAPTWVLWGDSHGWALKASFSAWLAERHEAGWVVNSPGCAALAGYRRDGYETDCRAVGDGALDFILHHDVSNVIMVSAWTNWFSFHTDFVDEESSGHSKAESTAVISRAFTHTLTRLHDAGIKVWICDPLPQARTVVPEAIAKSMLFGGDRQMAFSEQEYRQRNADFFRVLAGSADEICGRFEVERALCSTGICAVVNDRGPLYFDNNHPAAFQTDYFAALLKSSVAESCD
jgi:peptidoglycan/LPS O-acetylase OafA/YrhL